MGLTDFLFPRCCHVCGARLGCDERFVCRPCLMRIPRTLYHSRPDNPMEMRFAGIVRFERATGHFFYSRDSDIARIIQDFKYRHFRGLARYMGEVMAKELFPTGFLSDIDMILPVPMHFMKKARRGYNQTEQIAVGISKITGIPVANNLYASRPHRTQTKLSLEERRQNTSHLFRIRRPEKLEGKTLLLLDDVCTTGSTLTAVAEAVAEAVPTAKIAFLTLGVTF